MDTQENPYASPAADAGPASSDPEGLAELEPIRRQYLDHETSIRSIGVLYYVIAAMFAVSAAAGLSRMAIGDATGITGLVFGGAWALIFFVFGRGLRKLSPSVRIPVYFLSLAGLAIFPLGTLINGYVLYRIAGKKGRLVFSADYREVIRRMPHIPCRTSKAEVSVLLLLLLLGLLQIIVVALIPAWKAISL